MNKEGIHMQGNGPLNRKKKVTGTADESSMQTHEQVKTEGPVGNAGGYQERRDQAQGRPAQRTAPQGNPLGGTRPQQNRPAGGAPQVNPFAGGRTQQSQSRPQQSQARPQQARPQQTQQSRPQQTQQRPQQSQPTSAGYSSNTQRAASGGKKSPMLLIIAVVAALLLGGGGGLSGLFGGGSSSSNSVSTGGGSSSSSSLIGDLLGGVTDTGSTLSSLTGGTGSSSSALGGLSSSMLESLLGGSWYSSQTGYGASAATSSSSSSSSALSSVISGVLNRNVASGSRDKYTAIKGNGKDKVTLMVYMCGADLESRSGMATKDLQEMLNAQLGSNVKVIVFTGGSTSWRNDRVSSKVNQIWQIDNGKMKCLNDNAGTASMTNPATLSSFIQYCAKNFKANRYALILWDHGSGSVSGYGYDEKNSRSGSMTLAGLETAFKDGGVQYDFIGFDACLMATVENALMCSKYADYLIASEETEPGIGWYYTDWLTALGSNPSMATLDIGQKICDDFVSKCATSCRGQQTTLSVIDLAELEHTVPDKLKAFSQSVSSMIANKEYQTVSAARNGSREFAQSSRIDQVDLTDLCGRLNTAESKALAKVLKEAVKYNRINNISNAHGLSIYFPYKKISNVDKAVSTYAAIGMDDSYAEAIRAFASVEASGQAVTGGSSSAMPSLFGTLGSGSSSSSSGDMINDLLSAFLGGRVGSVSGLDSGNTGFLSGRTLDDAAMAEYLTAHLLDTEKLVFSKDGENWVMDLAADQWALVTGVDQNVFYDNGAGYVDLGLDNLFSFDGQGRMIADMDGTWLALNGQPVPYYRETSEYLDNGGWIITGRVPVMLNGQRADLLIVFDNEHEDGYVAGARAAYTDETETVAKALSEIEDGSTVTFLADLYDYNQNYTASYTFGNPITVSGEIKVSSVYLPDKTKMLVTYRVTDIYNQAYWTPVIGK